MSDLFCFYVVVAAIVYFSCSKLCTFECHKHVVSVMRSGGNIDANLKEFLNCWKQYNGADFKNMYCECIPVACEQLWQELQTEIITQI